MAIVVVDGGSQDDEFQLVKGTPGDVLQTVTAAAGSSAPPSHLSWKAVSTSERAGTDMHCCPGMRPCVVTREKFDAQDGLTCVSRHQLGRMMPQEENKSLHRP